MERNRGSVGRRRSKEELFAPYDLDGIVLPSDLDHMLHMNNSKYLREMDFGRVGMFFERGVYAAVLRNGGSFSLAAHCLRYRRSLIAFPEVCATDKGAVLGRRRRVRGTADGAEKRRVCVRHKPGEVGSPRYDCVFGHGDVAGRRDEDGESAISSRRGELERQHRRFQ
ncbi:Protein THEM6 [Geodia barretti]|uniref:Protein THEM6 n=1 Tax=Geodia barretti TaxID=519541 RepID=A0AA35VTP5_GEOBA|nr:Protein THEM6 [Geodia barretti]